MKRDEIEENHCKRYELLKHLEKHGNRHYEQNRFQRINKIFAAMLVKLKERGQGTQDPTNKTGFIKIVIIR